uniref:Bacterial Ig-like domain-containing protein n=1 Tax=Physcomitrium patens TaxID=3218 RepID=A0A7I4EM59_PHYPA
MSASKVLRVYWCCVVALIFLLSPVSTQGQTALQIEFIETPVNITATENAVFAFNVVDSNGSYPCAAQQCSFRCQLDQFPSQDCVDLRASFSNLTDGVHNFSVFVNTSSGASAASQFRWAIDTVAPTAAVTGVQAFTNALNVTLWIHGGGAVIPSTLKEIEKGRKYSVVVALPTTIRSGKIQAVIGRNSCTDAAGNVLRRTNVSSSIIRFDRRVPSVHLWTSVPSSKVIISNQARTVEATNNASDLRVYLDFDEPITSSAVELRRALSVSNGILTPIARKSNGNRHFGYALRNVTNDSLVSIALAGNTVTNRYGTPLPTNISTTFFYDTGRPQVQISTTFRTKTKDTVLPFVVQFTEPVFRFNSSDVAISGGNLRSFKEIDKSTYILEVTAIDNELVTVSVPENQTVDVAGNYNLASPNSQVRHYTTPLVSVLISSLITVGLSSTAMVSVAISISSATLEAVGAVSAQKIDDPRRNLLGLLGHLQILALSGWLAVSLPAEYLEVTVGLRWLIPHMDTPWQRRDVLNTGTSNQTTTSTILQNVISGRRRLLEINERLGNLQHNMHRGRELGANSTLDGPAMEASDYELYFLQRHTPNKGALESVLISNKYNGWQEFQRNMFWIGVVGGGAILLHILIVLFLRWRTRALIKGALIIPRFELYLLILAIPGLSQASAFIIRHGSRVSIAVGGLLLSVPVAFLIAVLVFLIYGIFMGRLVQYEEFRYEVQSHGYVQPQKPHGLVNLVAGAGFPGKWVRNNHLASTFRSRYGLIFEDFKGPPTILVHKRAQNLRLTIKRAGSTMKSPDSNDGSNDTVEVSDAPRVLGDARAAYILVDLSRRITLGLLFGLYPLSDHSWSQVGVIVGITAFQFVYLVVIKPFRRRGVQMVETIALLCELGVFVAGMVLLARKQPTDLNFSMGVFMLVLLVFSFVTQLVNEWYALVEHLMRLSTSQEPSLKDGLKVFARGLILPFTPHRMRGKFPGNQAPLPVTAVAESQNCRISAGSSHVESPQSVSSKSRPHPLATPLPLPTPESVSSNPGSVAQIMAINADSGPQNESEEIQAEASQRSERQTSRSHWMNILQGRQSQGRSQRGIESEELRTLRELAKASFPRHPNAGHSELEQAFATTNPVQGSPPIAKSREVDERRYVRKRRQFLDEPDLLSRGSSPIIISDFIAVVPSDSNIIFPREDPLPQPEPAHLVHPPTMLTSSPRRNNKGLGFMSSHSESLRDDSGAIRPLEER